MSLSGPDRPRPSRWRRLASFGALAAAAAVVAGVGPRIPKDQSVELRLPADRADVVGLDVTWTKPEDDTEAVLGASWNFDPGRAPPSIQATSRLADGSYEVLVTVRRVDRAEPSRRTVTLGEGETTVLVLR